MQSVDQLLADARGVLPHRPTPHETKLALESGTLVIDIRGDEQQRRDGHIPGTIIIRRNVLEWRCDPKSQWCHRRITSYGQRIILFCDEGYQSSIAAANLQSIGMSLATDMDGGFQLWRQLGLPIVPPANRFTHAVWRAVASIRNVLRRKN